MLALLRARECGVAGSGTRFREQKKSLLGPACRTFENPKSGLSVVTVAGVMIPSPALMREPTALPVRDEFKDRGYFAGLQWNFDDQLNLASTRLCEDSFLIS